MVDNILEREPSCEIHVLDIKLANTVSLPNVHYHTADITDSRQIHSLFQEIKPKTVFHVATAPAMSTNESLLRHVIVGGARNLLAASTSVGTVQAFIYTSTSSVVHDNVSDLIDADESLPVLDYPRQKKAYTLCKAIMEKEILAANNREANNGMLTVSIRPASNFGPRDYTQMGKIVESVRSGKARYQIGDGKNLYSFTYVTNTCDVHLLAALALLREYGKRPPRPDSEEGTGSDGADDRVDGQAFNVTNDEDWLFWEYQRGVAAAIGMPVKKEEIVVVPFWVAITMAWLAEWVIWLVTLGRGEAKITWEAMYYVAHHRTLKCEKAKKVLGYKPRVGMQEGLDIAGKWFVEEEEKRKKKGNLNSKDRKGK